MPVHSVPAPIVGRPRGVCPCAFAQVSAMGPVAARVSSVSAACMQEQPASSATRPAAGLRAGRGARESSPAPLPVSPAFSARPRRRPGRRRSTGRRSVSGADRLATAGEPSAIAGVAPPVALPLSRPTFHPTRQMNVVPVMGGGLVGALSLRRPMTHGPKPLASPCSQSLCTCAHRNPVHRPLRPATPGGEGLSAAWVGWELDGIVGDASPTTAKVEHFCTGWDGVLLLRRRIMPCCSASSAWGGSAAARLRPLPAAAAARHAGRGRC